MRSFPEERRSLDSVARSDRRTAANKEKTDVGNTAILAAKFRYQMR